MRTKIVLGLIFVLALVLRFYNLANFRCLNWDEAAFGYNAYSILTTGADEYGVHLPLQFKSVGDYKAPLYIYLMVPIIKLFGLNEFSVRLLPSLFGSFTVLSTYFIVLLLTKKNTLALLTSFLLAISPWHLQFTRAGADVAISNFFISLGILGFLMGIVGKKFGFILSLSGFIATIYSYFGERIFTPLIFLLLFLLYIKQVIKFKRKFIAAILFGLVISFPILPSLISGGHQEKILKTTVFGYKRPVEYEQQIIKEEPSKIFYYIFHTSFLENGLGVVNRYLNHFSPVFLFSEGVAKDPRQFVYGMGLIYLSDLPFLIIGMFSALKVKSKYKYFLFGWLLLAPIPAAITRDLTSARRSFNMLTPLLMFIALGYEASLSKISKLKNSLFRSLAVISLIVAFSFSVLYYLSSYYVFTKYRSFKGSAGWQCGYKELVNYISKVKDNYKTVVIDNVYQGPYIFFLFYENYSPAKYQPQAKLVQDSPDSLGESPGFDNYVFKKIYWPVDRGSKGYLFAGTPEDIPDRDIEKGKSEIIHTIYFPDNEEAFRIVKVY